MSGASATMRRAFFNPNRPNNYQRSTPTQQGIRHKNISLHKAVAAKRFSRQTNIKTNRQSFLYVSMSVCQKGG